jgi:hypothetical protein
MGSPQCFQVAKSLTPNCGLQKNSELMMQNMFNTSVVTKSLGGTDR